MFAEGRLFMARIKNGRGPPEGRNSEGGEGGGGGRLIKGGILRNEEGSVAGKTQLFKNLNGKKIFPSRYQFNILLLGEEKRKFLCI